MLCVAVEMWATRQRCPRCSAGAASYPRPDLSRVRVILQAGPVPAPRSYRIAGKWKRKNEPRLNRRPPQLPVHQLSCLQCHQKPCALTWKHYPTKRLRGEEFKLIGLVSLIPTLQAAQAHPGKLDAGKLHVQFERRTEVSAKATGARLLRPDSVEVG